MYKSFILTQAREEFREARLWYKNTQVTGLSNRFALEVKRAILKACKHPEHYAVRYSNVRIIYPDHFPYAIHFYLNEEVQTIFVLAIVYEGRNPALSKDRKK
jgi:hypothetical protein